MQIKFTDFCNSRRKGNIRREELFELKENFLSTSHWVEHIERRKSFIDKAQEMDFSICWKTSRKTMAHPKTVLQSTFPAITNLLSLITSLLLYSGQGSNINWWVLGF